MSIVETTEERRETEAIDRFTELLLDALYGMGLMPLSLSDKPSSFEKYPQELFVRLESHRPGKDVERAFHEWSTLLIRKPEYRSSIETAFPKLEAVYHWMVEQRDMLYRKSTLRHLRKSMFGRSYAYLFPRLALIAEYGNTALREGWLAEATGENGRLRAVADPAFVKAHFSIATPVAQERLRELHAERDVEHLVQATQRFLLDQQAYFNKVFREKVAKKEVQQ